MTRKTSTKIGAPDRLDSAQSPAMPPTVPPTGRARAPAPAALDSGSKVKTGPAPKRDQLIGMLSARSGAELAAISTRFGWLPHTTRAALSGLRKAGYQVLTEKWSDGKPARYRIAAQTGAAGPGHPTPRSTEPAATEMPPEQGLASTPPALTDQMAAKAGRAGDPVRGGA